MIERLRSIFRRSEPLPRPLWELLEEGETITLTEKQARVCRAAIWYARNNDFPPFGEEALDFAETLAFLHRRLSPQYGDYSARLIAVTDQARAALDEADTKGQLQ